MKQNFVNQLGFGSKGYRILLDQINNNYFLFPEKISPTILLRIKSKASSKKIGSVKIGQDRNLDSSILRLVKNLEKKLIQLLFQEVAPLLIILKGLFMK